MRREFLRGYLLALLSEGEFVGSRSLGDVVKKALAVFAQDLPAVMKELATVAAANGFQRATAAVLGKMEEIAKGIEQRGIGAVWQDIRDQYQRGVEANARKR